MAAVEAKTETETETETTEQVHRRPLKVRCAEEFQQEELGILTELSHLLG